MKNGDPQTGKVVIQLNLPALERLLGQDTELEANLRHQIVQEFTRRHLKEVATEEMLRSAQAWVKTEIVKAFGEYIGTYKEEYFQYTGTLRTNCERIVKETVRDLFQKEVEKFVGAYNAKLEEGLVRLVNNAVASQIHKLAERRINEEVAKRLVAVREGLESLQKAAQDLPLPK